ncbi:MAG: ferredoxin-type protein NapF [Candidatus Thiodiazotropha sp. (ex Ctena orbiculata)]|nr:ferredoxin-type protein NapF [Candidatus Thiodiazotropha taylori]
MLSRNIDRSQFLRGDLRGRQSEIRPPWSLSESRFTEVCERCNDCIEACPQKIITQGSAGFPKIDFSVAQCTFCGDCVKACKHQALGFDSDPNMAPWHLELSIEKSCLSQNGVVCRSCGDICEEAAICFKLATRGRSLPQVDQQKCNSCGACISVCPSHSISILPGTQTQAA